MELKEFIEQTLEQCKETMYQTLEGLTSDEVTWSPSPEANHIGFILWHVARVEDNWVQRFAQKKTEIWQRDGWPERLQLPQRDTGFGYTAEQIASFPTPALGETKTYFDSVRKETLEYLRSLNPSEFEVYPWPDRRPDYNIGRMFRQVICEENQHQGQMAYLRGLQRGLNQ